MKIVISLSIFLIISQVCCFILICNKIEQHSVHPIYGNYKKISSNLSKCQPWDDCK